MCLFMAHIPRYICNNKTNITPNYYGNNINNRHRVCHTYKKRPPDCIVPHKRTNFNARYNKLHPQNIDPRTGYSQTAAKKPLARLEPHTCNKNKPTVNTYTTGTLLKDGITYFLLSIHSCTLLIWTCSSQ